MINASRVYVILMAGVTVGTAGCGSIQLHAPRPLRVYMVVDRTTKIRKASVSSAQADTDYFNMYRTLMPQIVVLSKLQPDDSVTVIPLDDKTDDGDVRTFVIEEDETPGRREVPSLLRLRDFIAGIERSTQPGSDFAGALAFIRRESARRASSSEESGREAVVFFSDGEADGRQDALSGFPALPVWMFGTVRAEAPPRFQQIVKEGGVTDLHWIPFNQWETAGTAWGAEYARRSDVGVLNCLKRFPRDADPSGEQITYVCEKGKLPREPTPPGETL